MLSRPWFLEQSKVPAMALDPVSTVTLATSLTKILGKAIGFLVGLRGASNKVENHIDKAHSFRTIIDTMLLENNLDRSRIPLTIEAAVMYHLERSHDRCKKYTRLLGAIAASSMKIFKWSQQEQEVERQAEQLEWSISNLLSIVTMRDSCFPYVSPAQWIGV